MRKSELQREITLTSGKARVVMFYRYVFNTLIASLIAASTIVAKGAEKDGNVETNARNLKTEGKT